MLRRYTTTAVNCNIQFKECPMCRIIDSIKKGHGCPDENLTVSRTDWMTNRATRRIELGTTARVLYSGRFIISPSSRKNAASRYELRFSRVNSQTSFRPDLYVNAYPTGYSITSTRAPASSPRSLTECAWFFVKINTTSGHLPVQTFFIFPGRVLRS